MLLSAAAKSKTKQNTKNRTKTITTKKNALILSSNVQDEKALTFLFTYVSEMLSTGFIHGISMECVFRKFQANSSFVLVKKQIIITYIDVMISFSIGPFKCYS